MRVSAVFQKIIEDAAMGVFGTDLFISSAPPSPHNIIVIHDTAPSKMSERLYEYEYPTAQVYVRDFDYTIGYLKCTNLVELLDKNVNFDFTDAQAKEWHVVGIQKFSGPFVLSQDDDKRSQFTINFLIQIQPK